jgi:aspartate/methionine/tyrosine aminotransferase
LRRAWVDWSVRSLAATPLDPSAVAVTVGSKELVGLLPTLLGFGPGDVVAIPQLAYPTYEVGALAAGATPVRYDPLAGGTDLALGGPAGAGRLLLWLNSPANPNGSVLDAARTRALVDAGRERGAVVASDECYAAFGWDAEPVSVLRRDIHGGDLTGLLAVHSLSKRSNLAGYRVGFVAGDPALIDRLVAVRRHLGLIVAMPVQHAAAVALADDAHVERALRRPAGRDGRRAHRGRAADRCVRGRALSVGHREPVRGGHRRPPGRSRHPRGSRHVLRGRRCPTRPGRADRDRRADRRRRRPAHRRRRGLRIGTR